MALNPSVNFWHGKRVLLTGHTGFKGAWLTLWLYRMGAKVTGISLRPTTIPNLYTLAAVEQLCKSLFVDIRDGDALTQHIQAEKPEVVFHLAAQALVRPSYHKPLETFSTNVMGTANVMESVRNVDSARVVVTVTTDKVYENLEQVYPYRETDTIGGYDPYSASKAAAEMIIASYRAAFLKERDVGVATARAGNVIGGGDWSNDRLIPDAIRAWSRSQPLKVRNPGAVRPWQHVLEPLSAYLRLAEQLWDKIELSGPYNIGPVTHEVALVRDVISKARTVYGSGAIIWEEGHEDLHETNWLVLEIAKCRQVLGIQPRWSLEEAINRTMQWYLQQQNGADVWNLCDKDISSYEAVGSDVST